MIKWIVTTVAVLLQSGSLIAQTQPPANVMRLVLDSRELGQLQRDADRALQKAPDPLSLVHVEGTLPTTEAYKRANAAKADWPMMSALASAYASIPDKSDERANRYLAGYEKYLTAWLDVYVISGNPIDETDLGNWLLAFRTAGGALTMPTQIRMRSFACDLSARYQQRPIPGKSTSTNNWQSHRVKLAVMGAQLCDDPQLKKNAQELFFSQIQANLMPTGEAIDYFERDALHYVVYSLEPLLEAALFSSFYDRPLYVYQAPQGQSLLRSLEWLAPFVRGEQAHMEFVKSTVRFDAQRAAAGVAGFSGPFKPEKARHLYWLAARLDPNWSSLSEFIGPAWITQRAGWLSKPQ